MKSEIKLQREIPLTRVVVKSTEENGFYDEQRNSRASEFEFPDSQKTGERIGKKRERTLNPPRGVKLNGGQTFGILNESQPRVDVLPHRKNAHRSVACLRLNARKRSYQIVFAFERACTSSPYCFRKQPVLRMVIF